MPISVIPSTLPKPATYSYTDAGLASTSSLPGAHYALSRNAEPVGEAEVTFFLNSTQAAIFLEWWKTDLMYGGCWFACSWMTPRGSASVAKFVAEPSFRHAGDGAYYVTVPTVLRGDTNAVLLPCLEGPTWAAASPPAVNTRTNPAYGKNTFVIGGTAVTTGNAQISYSLDFGATWTNVVLGAFSGNASRVCFGNGYFFADIHNATVAFSPDGINWTGRAVTVVSTTAALPWAGGGKFFRLMSTPDASNAGKVEEITPAGVTSGLRLMTSSAGNVSFFKASSGGCYNNGVHIAWGSSGACYSTDGGLTWREASTPGWQWPLIMHPTRFGFVAVPYYAFSSTGLLYSADGKAWQTITLPYSRQWRGYAYGRGVHTLFGPDLNNTIASPYVFTSLDLFTGWAPAANSVFTPARTRGYERFATGGDGKYVGCMVSGSYEVGYGVC